MSLFGRFANAINGVEPGTYVSGGIAQMLETPATVQVLTNEINRFTAVDPVATAQFRNDLFNLKQLLSAEAAAGPLGIAAAAADDAARIVAIDARIADNANIARVLANPATEAAINASRAARKNAAAVAAAAAIGAKPPHMICTYNEVLAKFHANKYAGLTPNELVRLFSPPESLYDYDLTTQEGYDAWFDELSVVPTRAYNLSLDSQDPAARTHNANAPCTAAQQGIAQGVANKKIADIINSTSGYF